MHSYRFPPRQSCRSNAFSQTQRTHTSYPRRPRQLQLNRINLSNFVIITLVILMLIFHGIVSSSHNRPLLRPQQHTSVEFIDSKLANGVIPMQSLPSKMSSNSSSSLSPIDPYFARYLMMLNKNHINSMIGRKFLSADSDVVEGESIEDEDIEQSNFQHIVVPTGHNSVHAVQLPNKIDHDHNITRVAFMVLRVIATYNVKSMVDIPCGAHSQWMGVFLNGASSRLSKPFLYYCVDEQRSVVEEAENEMPDVDGVNVNFIQREFWVEPLPQADLIFSWDGLQKGTVLHVHTLFDHVLRQKHHRYVLISSSPSIKRNIDGNTALNFRRAPFSYGMPDRMFKNLAIKKKPCIPEKHLYFYTVKNLKSAHGHKRRAM